MWDPKLILRALLPFALHGLARQVDAALGVLLHSSLDLPDIVRHVLGLLSLRQALAAAGSWALGGAALWIALGVGRQRFTGEAPAQALRASAGFGALYLRPALTLLALAALGLRPTFPYASTLSVALTQDWAPAQDAATLAALLATAAWAPRFPAPRPADLCFLAFLGYALLTPERARVWQGHPGNEPKYLRMGAALGNHLGLDVAPWTELPESESPLEAIEPRPLTAVVPRAMAALARQSSAMVAALWATPRGLGADAIRATRIDRQTVAGKAGGVFHVLAPAPSVLLAPTLRLDRALNLARRTPGRLDVSVLAWNALAAGLVTAMFLLIREATGRPGLSALLAAGLGLTPPFLFYGFQFYPEMPAALVLAVVLRKLLFVGRPRGRELVWLSWLIASLPWLHQKFAPVWCVLALMAFVRAVDALVSLRQLAALLLPQILSIWLFTLWNFAITGSVRPDALFLAWGPAGVSGARVHEGVLGLLFDARYGLVPYVPIYLLAAGGLFMAGRGRERLVWGLPPVAVYYVTVAAADNWSGSVSNLGRYVMPALPLAAAWLGVALQRLDERPGARFLWLTLALWTGLLAVQLWRDPHAADDGGVLLAKSTYADPNVYLPNLFFRSEGYRAPGHGMRVAAWLGLAAIVALWSRRVAWGRGGGSVARALAAGCALALGLGLVLEAWPGRFRAPRFQDAVAAGGGATIFVSGPVEPGPDALLARTGALGLLVRSRVPVTRLRLRASGDGQLEPDGQPAVPVAGAAELSLALDPALNLTGRRGATESLASARLSVRTLGGIRLSFEPETAEPGAAAPR